VLPAGLKSSNETMQHGWRALWEPCCLRQTLVPKPAVAPTEIRELSGCEAERGRRRVLAQAGACRHMQARDSREDEAVDFVSHHFSQLQRIRTVKWTFFSTCGTLR